MVRKPLTQQGALRHSRGSSPQAPQLGFSDEEHQELERALKIWTGSSIVWAILPKARAVWVRGTNRAEAVARLAHKVRRITSGGLVFWLLSEETDELRRLAKGVSRSEASARASRTSGRRGALMPPGETVESDWDGEPVRVVVLGRTRGFLQRLSATSRTTAFSSERRSEPSPAQIHDLFPGQPTKAKFDNKSDVGVKSAKLRQSERKIEKTTSPGAKNKVPLPDEPARYWSGGFRGKPRAETTKALLAFLREVYGPYMDEHRGELRAYLWRKDAKLYQAVMDYERHSKLPKDLRMPTRPQKVESRLREAFRRGLEGLEKPARRSVTGKLRRMDRGKTNPEF